MGEANGNMSEQANDETGGISSRRLMGLVAGPVAALAVAVFFRIDGGIDALTPAAELTAAIAVLMAIWWASEALPLAVTALLPIILFPLAGIMDMRATTASYANPIIFLFLGGFIVALAIERSQMHRRIALLVFKNLGRSAAGLVGGFMGVAALFSMWISNTSTVLMLFPIALSMGLVLRETVPEMTAQQLRHFKLSLLLGLAYAASIGGMATLVGTPTNAFMVGFLEAEYNVAIAFIDWMAVGVPAVVFLLPLGWLLLTRLVFPLSFTASDEIRQEFARRYAALGPISKAEKRTGLVFLLLVFGWTLRRQISQWTGIDGLSDTGIAMMAALLAFLIPSGTDRHALVTWEDTKRLPWGVLLLFGGGLALAAALSDTGLTLWLGQQLAPLGMMNALLLVVALTTLVIFLTELTSNVATTATLLPVVAAIAVQLQIDPLLFVVPVTMAASCAFMLPVATPPNAIVFGDDDVTIADMMRAGFRLNLIAIVLVSALAAFWVPVVLG